MARGKRASNSWTWIGREAAKKRPREMGAEEPDSIEMPEEPAEQAVPAGETAPVEQEPRMEQESRPEQEPRLEQESKPEQEAPAEEVPLSQEEPDVMKMETRIFVIEQPEPAERPSRTAERKNPARKQEKAQEEEPETLEGILYSWAQALTAAVVGVVLLFTFFVRLIAVSGPSMQNTLYTGDRLLVLNSMFCDFKQGDVVVINAYNAELSDTLVKRIIAVGGQTVDIDFVTGTVYVDGQALEESYIKEPTYTPEGTAFPLTLAEDEVFVMGDNRNHSTDSRSTTLGPVNVGYLQGKALFLVMPGKTPDPADPGNADKGTREWGRIGVIH